MLLGAGAGAPLAADGQRIARRRERAQRDPEAEGNGDEEDDEESKKDTDDESAFGAAEDDDFLDDEDLADEDK